MKKNFPHFILSSIFLTSCVAANDDVAFSLPSFDFSKKMEQCSPLPTSDIVFEKKPDFNSLRIGKILSDRPQETPIPKLNTIYEMLDFTHALFEGEQQFWQDTQVMFRESNKRLNTILSMVENAIKGLPATASKLQIINIKYQTQLQILSICSEEDYNNHQIYNSYKESIDYFEGLNSLLLDLEKKENIQFKTIKETIDGFILDKKNKFKQVKKLRTTSGVKSINDDLKKKTDYYSCDLDQLIYSSDEIVSEIFNSYNNGQKISTPPKKRKKTKQTKPKNYKKNSFLTPTETVETILPIRSLADLALEESVAKNKTLEEPAAPLVSSALISQDQAEENDSLIDNANEEIVETVLVETAEEAIDSAPWKKYKNKRTSGKDALGRTLIVPSAKESKINSSIQETILSFFSTEKKYVTQNVPMQDFIQLLSIKFEGYVYRVNEQLHFMAKHSETHKWHSVCMHVLHKDNKSIIPRNTLYWTRAKHLLTELNVLNLLDKKPNQPSF